MSAADHHTRRRHQLAWAAAANADHTAMRQIAADPHASAYELAILLPDPAQCLTDLAQAIPAHPNVTAGITGRLVTHRDPAVRHAVAAQPRTTPPVLPVLAHDPDPDVAAATHR